MDGYNAFNAIIPNRVAKDPIADILTTHHYEKDPEDVFLHIKKSIEKM